MNYKLHCYNDRCKEMEKLPEDWKRIKLGEIIIESNKSPFKVEDADNNGYYPFFTSGEAILTHSDYLVDCENLFLSTGGTAYIGYYKGKAAYSADTYAIKSKIITKYLYYFLSKQVDEITYRYFIGSGLEHLQKDFFKKDFEILFPENQAEQEKIAEILETVDNTIEKTDAIIEKYKRTKQGLMQELLTKGIDINWHIRSEKTHKFKDSPLGRISADWEVKKLGEVSKIVSGFSFPLSFQGKESGLYPFIKVDDLNSSYKYIKEARNYINNKEKKELSVKTFHKGTLVFPKIGMAVYLNKFRLLDKEATFDNNVAGIVPIDIDKEFIYYYFLSEIDLRKIASETALPSIKKSTLENLQIPLPPLPEQERIASVLSQVDTVIEKETAYRDKLSRIKQGLMEDLLTGKVRVTTLLENNQYQKETFI